MADAGITLADVSVWSVASFDEVMSKLRAIAQKNDEASDLLKNQEVFSTWGGASARAAYVSVAGTGSKLEENSKKAAVLAEVCRRASGGIGDCKVLLKAIERDCSNAGLGLN